MTEKQIKEMAVIRPLRGLADQVEKERKVVPWMGRQVGMLICRGQTLGIIAPGASVPIDKAVQEEDWATLASELRFLAQTIEKYI